MFYDVIVNKGGKGQVCAELENKTFEINKILPQVNESDYNTNDWKQVKDIILSNI